MTREEFNSLCQDCCWRKSIAECLFADAEEGFIDTSAESDGSRGIAFSKRKMMVNLDGAIKIVAYKKIRSIHIIVSLEGAFADELEISGEHSRLRITDFSLDKHILKQIIEGLREGITESVPVETQENRGVSADAEPVETQENRGVSADAEPVETQENGGISADAEPVETQENGGVSADAEPVETRENGGISADAEPVETRENGGVSADAEPVETRENGGVSADAEPVETRENGGISADAEPVEMRENGGVSADAEPVETQENGGVSADAEPVETRENGGVSADAEPVEMWENSVISADAEPVATRENGGVIDEFENKIEWLSDAKNEIPDDKIEWLSDMTAESAAPVIPETEFSEHVFREQIEQMSHEETLGFLSKTLGEINGDVFGNENTHERKAALQDAPRDIDESVFREQIEQMSHEETLGFLSKTLGEINGDADYNIDNESDPTPFFPTTQTAIVPENAIPPKSVVVKKAPEKPAVHTVSRDNGELSKEPIWGDIYIKASKSLRELCENGRLSMDIIEKELREKLLDCAKSFADIVKDEQKIPKTLVPRIAELKNAADHFDEYFSHGEDVGVRVMFFMLFQMLSYSDRIAENPETKEGLNDFFRRFGTAGITLSMLDARG